ncbi:MAG TPA: 50S ribosomal protein L15 [Oligoflexia bacterium]|nr:50S ribosomal protein L15 [Oligoflexia bacterium]HMR25755.1 50S ribosomal protein L15 [Oligoflexia bacterium]
MDLSNLKSPEGSRKKRKRVGRGHGSGWGKTSGKGHKGQNARSGGGVNPAFEGGQMPLVRRLPKFGFTNIFKKKYAVVNLDAINAIEIDGPIDLNILKDAKIIRKKSLRLLKVLGDGSLDRKVHVVADAFSASAKAAIEKAGGTAELIQNLDAQTENSKEA